MDATERIRSDESKTHAHKILYVVLTFLTLGFYPLIRVLFSTNTPYTDGILVYGERKVATGRFHWLQYAWALVWSWAVIGIFMLITMATTEIVITNRRVIYKRGWIARKTEELGLKRIEEVNLKQGVLGRILGYGRVQFQGVGVSSVKLPVIRAPMAFRRALEEAKAELEMKA